MFSNSLLGFALSTSVVEYEVNTSATSVCLFFHLWGHMGFSITAAAVTVTVATFDTLAFCEMKLQFSHLNWRTNVRQSYRKYSLDQKNTCAFCFSRCRTELLHQKAKKKIVILLKKGGNSSFSTIHFASALFKVLWRFLQETGSQNLFGELCTLSFPTLSSWMWCNASEWLAGDGNEDVARCAVPVSGQYEQASSSL